MSLFQCVAELSEKGFIDHPEYGGGFFHSHLSKLIFILFPEAVTSWEEIPAPFLVHLPDVRFLSRVLCLIFVNQIHEEEQVVG